MSVGPAKYTPVRALRNTLSVPWLVKGGLRLFTHNTRLQLALLAGLLVLSFFVSFPQFPTLTRQGRDSGVFAYVGQVILDGGVPYRDAWDNKTPAVYYYNALAFLLFGDNLWAIWVIQAFVVFATGLLCFVLLKTLYGRWRFALVGTVIFVFQSRHALLIGAGNFTETYALLPQVLCLLAGYHFLRGPGWRASVLLGLSAGLAFLTKQNTISVALVFFPAMLLSRHPLLYTLRRWWPQVIVIGLAGLLMLGSVALYLQAEGTLEPAIEATFFSPTAFHEWVSRGAVPIWETVYTSLTSTAVLVSMGPLAPFAIYGLVTYLRRGLKSRPQSRSAANKVTFGLWVALTFVFDMVLANVTNRGGTLGYAHYYVTPMLTYVLMVLVPLERLNRQKTPQSGYNKRRVGLLVYVVIVVLGWIPGAVYVLNDMGATLFGPPVTHPVAGYVRHHTQPDDTVLVWGASTMINFQTHRHSPTQFSYGYALLVPGEYSRKNIREFIHDLETARPPLIIDATLNDGDRIPPLDPQARRDWWADGGRQDVENLQPVYDFVADHCEIVEKIDLYWIYECRYEVEQTAVRLPPGL